FGSILRDKPGPGLYIGLPWGMDQVERVPVGRVRRVTVGQAPPDGEEDRSTPPAGQLLTGDHNLVNLQVEIFYSVLDQDEAIAKFVVQAERIEGLVARVTETALAEWAAGRTVDEVLLRGKATLPGWLMDQVQQRPEAYDLGVE